MTTTTQKDVPHPSVKVVQSEEEAAKAAAEAQWPAGKPPPAAAAAAPVHTHRDYGMDPEAHKPKSTDAGDWADHFLAKHRGRMGIGARGVLIELLEDFVRAGGKAPSAKAKATAADDEEPAATPKHDTAAAHSDSHKKK